MANRRYSQFDQRRPAPDGERPSPGLGSMKQPGFTPGEGSGYPGAPGPKGPALNTVKFAEVKAYAAQDLADDKGLKGKSMKLGGGGRFAALEAKAKASGAKNPAAVAAAAGIAKYGQKKMTKMAVAGRKRAAKRK